MKALQLKLDEVNEDYENLMELTQAKQKKHDLIINDLNNVIINLMNDIKKTLLSVFEYFGILFGFRIYGVVTSQRR